jgi:phosphoribosylanthranilate isomerase
MSLWIKICANTSLEDACMAANAGADAVGFVFAPSPRRVSVQQVAEIVPHLPEDLEKVGVFVDSQADEIACVVRTCRLTGVQLHAECGVDTAARLRAEFGADLHILRVVHFGPDASGQAARCAADPGVDAILIDSRTATAVGGTGIAFDWDTASRTVFASGAAKFIAAGGLRPDNVAEAIAKLRPWGADVASGVEAEPGRKDPVKVRAFIANARAASSQHR